MSWSKDYNLQPGEEVSLRALAATAQCSNCFAKKIIGQIVNGDLIDPVTQVPQAGILANKRLKRKLEPFGYHKCKNTPGLWYHTTKSITFTLVFDDFGLKYVDKSDVEHLITMDYFPG